MKEVHPAPAWSESVPDKTACKRTCPSIISSRFERTRLGSRVFHFVAAARGSAEDLLSNRNRDKEQKTGRGRLAQTASRLESCWPRLPSSWEDQETLETVAAAQKTKKSTAEVLRSRAAPRCGTSPRPPGASASKHMNINEAGDGNCAQRAFSG